MGLSLTIMSIGLVLGFIFYSYVGALIGLALAIIVGMFIQKIIASN